VSAGGARAAQTNQQGMSTSSVIERARAAQAAAAARDPLQASRNGDPAAVVQNLQNIIDATRGRFKADFVKQYQHDHGGKSPSEGVVDSAYFEQLMKGFTAARYESFGRLAGVDPERLNPVFSDPKVTEMYNSFPDAYVPPGSKHDPISINHLLSGIQWHTTSADHLVDSALKNTVGVGVNANLAEDVVKSRDTQEKGQGGIFAAKSEELQSAFRRDPVAALKGFLANPDPYIQSGKSTIHFNPFEGYQRLGHEILSAIRKD